jgi:hypothetical protein
MCEESDGLNWSNWDASGNRGGWFGNFKEVLAIAAVVVERLGLKLYIVLFGYEFFSSGGIALFSSQPFLYRGLKFRSRTVGIWCYSFFSSDNIDIKL